MHTGQLKTPIQTAMATVLCLIGSIMLGIALGTLIHAVLPGHMMDPKRLAPAALGWLLTAYRTAPAQQVT